MSTIKLPPASGQSQLATYPTAQPPLREGDSSWGTSLLAALRVQPTERGEQQDARVAARRVTRAESVERRRSDEQSPGVLNVASVNAQKLREPAAPSELSQPGDARTTDARPRERDRARSAGRDVGEPRGGASAPSPAESTPARAAQSARTGAGASHEPAAAPMAGTLATRAGTAPGAPVQSGAHVGRAGVASPAGTSAAQAKQPVGGIAPGGARVGAFEKLLKAAEPQRSSAQRTHVAQSALQGVSMALRSNGGDAVIRLTPEGLGALRVHVSVRDSSVSATFTTTTESAREMLENSRTMLRDALEARGLHVDQIVVQGPGTEARPDHTTQGRGAHAFAGDTDGGRDPSHDPRDAADGALPGADAASDAVPGIVPDTPPDSDRVVWLLA